jgi:hypothetical protein
MKHIVRQLYNAGVLFAMGTFLTNTIYILLPVWFPEKQYQLVVAGMVSTGAFACILGCASSFICFRLFGKLRQMETFQVSSSVNISPVTKKNARLAERVLDIAKRSRGIGIAYFVVPVLFVSVPFLYACFPYAFPFLAFAALVRMFSSLRMIDNDVEN